MKYNYYNDNKNIAGKIIREHRKKQKISRDKLCSKLSLLGITLYENDLFLIENNGRILRDYELIAIFKILNISFEKLNTCIKIE